MLALLLAGGDALAGRGSPESLIEQLLKGYGVVEAAVRSARVLPKADPSYSDRYDIAFTVESVLSETVAGRPLGLKVGSRFELRTAIGYGATIEHWRQLANGAPAPGTRYLLVLRRAATAEWFEHAEGSGAAELIAEVHPDRRRFVGLVRQLAELPDDVRLSRCRGLVTDETVEESLRLEAIAHLRFETRRREPDSVDEATLRTFLAAFEDPHSSDNLIRALDHALRSMARAETREARRTVWFDRAFATLPPKAGSDHIRQRLEQFQSLQHLFYDDDPGPVGQRVIAEIQNERWPLALRCHLASLLRHGYQWVVVEQPTWRAALDRFHSAALDDAANDGSAARLLCTSLKTGLGDLHALRRRYEPSPAVADALDRLVDRLRRDRDQGRAVEHCEINIADASEVLRQIRRNPSSIRR